MSCTMYLFVNMKVVQKYCVELLVYLHKSYVLNQVPPTGMRVWQTRVPATET